LAAYLHVQGNEFLPIVQTSIVQRILPIDPTNVWTVGINGTLPAGCAVMSACAIASIQEPRFIGQVNMLAAQAALGARECLHHLANDASHFRVLAELPIS